MIRYHQLSSSRWFLSQIINDPQQSFPSNPISVFEKVPTPFRNNYLPFPSRYGSSPLWERWSANPEGPNCKTRHNEANHNVLPMPSHTIPSRRMSPSSGVARGLFFQDKLKYLSDRMSFGLSEASQYLSLVRSQYCPQEMGIQTEHIIRLVTPEAERKSQHEGKRHVGCHRRWGKLGRLRFDFDFRGGKGGGARWNKFTWIGKGQIVQKKNESRSLLAVIRKALPQVGRQPARINIFSEWRQGAVEF